MLYADLKPPFSRQMILPPRLHQRIRRPGYAERLCAAAAAMPPARLHKVAARMLLRHYLIRCLPHEVAAMMLLPPLPPRRYDCRRAIAIIGAIFAPCQPPMMPPLPLDIFTRLPPCWLRYAAAIQALDMMRHALLIAADGCCQRVCCLR